jgi:hypothetical protein
MNGVDLNLASGWHSWRGVWHGRPGLIALLFTTAVACTRNETPSPSSSTNQAPGRGDSLAKLIRAMLTAPDPGVPYQAMMCETKRLILLYGPEGAESIRQEVVDTIYTRNDRAARRRVESKLAHRVFYSACDSSSRAPN